jgi:hypothetical protein
MRKSLVVGTTAIALAMAFAIASDAFAKGSGGVGGGPPGGGPPGFNSPGRQVGFASTNRPPGWSHGQKRGWLRGNCKTIGSRNCIPPGLR